MTTWTWPGHAGTVRKPHPLAPPCAQEADTEIVVAIVKRAAAAMRRPAEAGGAVPTAAPIHAERARGRARGIHCSAARVIPIPVLHPLPDIAMHVIETPGVGLQL